MLKDLRAFFVGTIEGKDVMTTMRENEQRQTELLPEFLTKKQVALLLQCSQRQVEILTKKQRICRPVYLGSSSPRWNRVELLESLTDRRTK